MSDDTGYAIIRNAIPPDLALEAAEMVSGSLRVKVARDKFTEFEVPDICLRVQQEFIEKYGKHTHLAELLESNVIPPPKSINVGIFHKTTADPTKLKTGLKGEVYATIALTDLSPLNGLFIFLAKSHKRTPESISITEWEQKLLDLKAGDVVLWRGDLAYLHSSGGGGKFETLVFSEQ